MLGNMFYRMKKMVYPLIRILYKNRYFLFIVSRLPKSWVNRLGLNPVLVKPVDKVFEYIKKNRRRLDQSYQKEENQLGLIIEDGPGGEFSRNIESVIYDKEKLNESLVYPDNQLEKAWMRRIMIENTPRGNVYMYYDIFLSLFSSLFFFFTTA